MVTRTRKQIQRRLRQTEVQELISSYLAGDIVYELAETFRIHRQTVSAILERGGVSRRHRSMTPTSSN